MSLHGPRLRRVPRPRARGRSPTSTPRRRRRRRGRVIEAMDRYYREARATVHRGDLPARRRGDGGCSRARATASPRSRGSTRRRDDLHPQRDRGDQPRRVRRGAARTSAPGDRIVAHGDGAPLQHRAVADAGAGARRDARLGRRSTTTACSTSTRSTTLLARGPKLVAVAHVSNVARHDQPARGDRRAARTPPARSSWSTARRPSRTCRSTSRARRRLLRLDRPQGLRPDRHRRAARPPRAARGDAAVPRRRAHDRARRPRRARPTPSRPRKFEAGTSDDRRGDRARRRRRLPRRDRDGRGPRARARDRRPTRWSASASVAGPHDPRPARRRAARRR